VLGYGKSGDLGVWRGLTKVNTVYCAMSRSQVCRPFFFAENTVNGINYLDMLKNWLMPQFTDHDNTCMFQQGGALPHWTRRAG
jgi:hypothetical protein